MIIVQVGQKDRGNGILGNPTGKQMFVQIGNGINQDIRAVVAQRQSGAGLIGGEAGCTAEDFQPQLDQIPRNEIGLHLVGRENMAVFTQVNGHRLPICLNTVFVLTGVADPESPYHCLVTLEGNNVEETSHLLQ